MIFDCSSCLESVSSLALVELAETRGSERPPSCLVPSWVWPEMERPLGVPQRTRMRKRKRMKSFEHDGFRIRFSIASLEEVGDRGW